ncbi:MAG: ABC transporter substrate-binding protein [Corticimicrobacter sp.]|uniref:ABC transporter substrate-binding protein n=1 Tax=Corticimicrobacter sp. TaxID=2678536 RepID=UPI0032DBE50F
MGNDTDKHGKSGWSRRDILRLSMATGLSMSAAGLLLYGGPALAEAPRRGGRLRVAASNSSVADTLDPAKGTNSGDYMRQFMFYSGLTELDDQMHAQPALAESFESPDGRVWHLKLRQGVVFHDGKPFTADDVVYSLLRHKDPATASKAKSLADQFETVVAEGPHDVRIELVSPNVDLPALLGTSHFLIIADGTTDFALANGTGPYRSKSFTPGGSVVGVRNENFWKNGKPYLDEIELIGLTDQAARVNGLLAGDLHMVTTVGPRDIERLRAGGRHEVLETRSGLYTNLILRQDADVVRDPDFVMAMKYLQNRERVRDAILRGYGTLANDHPVPDWHPYYMKDLPQRAYDPDRARFHVERGKLQGKGGDLVCTPNVEGSVDGAQLLQQSARTVGLQLNVRRVPYDGYWSNHWMKHPMSYGSINPRPTLDALFSQFYKSDSPWNESGWQNTQFDELLVQARAELDEGKRKQMYGDMQVLISEQCSVLIPVFISFLDAYDKRVKGLTPNPAGMLMGYRFAEDVWLDA